MKSEDTFRCSLLDVYRYFLNHPDDWSVSKGQQDGVVVCLAEGWTKDRQTAAPSFMGHLLSSRPNEILAIDFTLLKPSQNGLENVLILSDVFSKYTLAIPTRNQRASTVAQALVSQWFYKFSVPARIHSDQGRNFESSLIQQLCGLYWVEKSRTTPYHYAGND